MLGVEIWPEITLLPKITVFDPEWIIEIVEGMADWFGDIAHGVVEGMIGWIIESVFNAVEPYLDKLAGEYYERHTKE